MFLTKRNGVGIPSYPRDKEEWDKVREGAEVKVTLARNPYFHRKFFALLNLGFENQETYSDFEIYRMVMIMKAGFVVFVLGKDGKEHPLPKSISFEKMDETEFEKLFKAVREIISKEIGVEGSRIESELAGFY